MIDDLDEKAAFARDVITRRLGASVDEYPLTSALTPGVVLADRYIIERRLGSGGMGTVYKAVDRLRRENPEIACHVAIKILHEETRWRPKALARLSREFYCAQALSHRSVIKVFELDRDDDFAFFTMEFLEGELLSELIKQHDSSAVPRSLAWTLIREIGEGVAHAHSRNVVHADLKPQNIMVTKSGDVRILDFGASSDSIRRTPDFVGTLESDSTAATPAYASWELLDGQQADPRDDLFALACLSYELLAGAHPFQHRGSTQARKLGLTPSRPPGLSRRQWQALSLGLKLDRESRSRSVNDWLASLVPAAVTNKKPNARWAAVLAGCAVCLSGWVALHSSAITQASGAAPVIAGRTSSVAADTATPATGVAPASAVALPSAVARPSEIHPPNTESSNGSRPSSLSRRGSTMGIASAVYRMRADKNFAEIHVRRSSGSNAHSSFAWWTEPDSAAAGVDFVSQHRTTTSFLPGRRTAALFIKLVPDYSRKQPKVFYVFIADPAGHGSLGISKAAVALMAAN